MKGSTELSDLIFESCEKGIVIENQWTAQGDGDLHLSLATDMQCILIIEKEGIYHRLCEDNFHL